MTEQEQGVLGTPVTRRRMLQGSTLAGIAAFLAACGTSATSPSAEPTAAPTPASSAPPASTAPSPTQEPTPAQTPSAELNWANWTYYIDVDENDPNKHPTLDRFKEKHGTTVKYQEVVDDNDTFFGTIKDALSGGQDTGWDIVTLTDWMAIRLVRLGWLERFDKANMPNFAANLKDRFRSRPWDPGNDYAAPWQSGMTGLGYDEAVTGPLTSVKALFTDDPRWRGKVEYLTEMRDTIGLTMISLGLDLAKPDRAGCDAAIAVLRAAQDAGIVRDVKGNSYAEDLKSGDAVLATAWSGDMMQAVIEKESLRFTIPDEGGVIWTDNCMIPKGAAHKFTAELAIDFYYDPENMADVELYVYYLSPVKGADEVMLQKVPEIKDDPIAFPPAEVQARLVDFGALSEDDEKYFNDQFASVLGVG
jgi:spermidine/putrescine transport system substrate-binding protein